MSSKPRTSSAVGAAIARFNSGTFSSLSVADMESSLLSSGIDLETGSPIGGEGSIFPSTDSAVDQETGTKIESPLLKLGMGASIFPTSGPNDPFINPETGSNDDESDLQETHSRVQSLISIAARSYVEYAEASGSLADSDKEEFGDVQSLISLAAKSFITPTQPSSTGSIPLGTIHEDPSATSQEGTSAPGSKINPYTNGEFTDSNGDSSVTSKSRSKMAPGEFTDSPDINGDSSVFSKRRSKMDPSTNGEFTDSPDTNGDLSVLSKRRSKMDPSTNGEFTDSPDTNEDLSVFGKRRSKMDPSTNGEFADSPDSNGDSSVLSKRRYKMDPSTNGEFTDSPDTNGDSSSILRKRHFDGKRFVTFADTNGVPPGIKVGASSDVPNGTSSDGEKSDSETSGLLSEEKKKSFPQKVMEAIKNFFAALCYCYCCYRSKPNPDYKDI